MTNRTIALTAVLVALAANAGQVEEPRLSLDPSSGPPGSEVNASGSGFLNSPCGVDLFLDSPRGPLLGFASIDDGFFSTTIVIPSNTATGEHKVIAQGLLFGPVLFSGQEFCDGVSGEEAQAAFTVPVPSPPSFSLETFSAGAIPKGVATGDLNQDGSLDAVVVNAGDDSVSVIEIENDIIVVGSEPEAKASTGLSGPMVLPVGSTPGDVIVEDLNGDQIPDIAVANFSRRSFSSRINTVSVLFGLGGGQFAEQIEFPVGFGPSALVAGNFNDDNLKDLAVANVFDNTISVLFGDEAEGFTGPENFETPTNPQDLVAGDFDGNGSLDLAVALLFNPTEVVLLLGNGQGGFTSTAPPDPPTGTQGFESDDSAVALDAADLDGNGTLDLAFVSSETNVVSVRFGDGNGGFSEPVVLSDGFPIQVRPRDVAIGDLNGDGLLDLAVVNHVSENIAVFLGAGQGRFSEPVTYHVGAVPTAIAIADPDSDGFGDLFVSTIGLSVLSNFPRFSPAPLAPFISSVTPSSGPPAGGTAITVRGLNFETGAGLTIGGSPATDVVVLPASQITAVTPLGMVGVADVVVTNPDGKSDTRLGGFTYTTEPVPASQLTFTRLVYCGDGVGPDCSLRKFKDADVGDLDGDGAVDIFAATSRKSGTDQLFRNTGLLMKEDRTFTDGMGMDRTHTLAFGLFDVSDVAPGQSPEAQYDVQLADIDGDDDLDAIGVNASPLRVLINDGSGNFVDEAGANANNGDAGLDALDRVYTAANEAAGLVDTHPPFTFDDVDIGDVDNDGDLDIVVANRDNHGGVIGTLDFLLLNDEAANPGFGFFSVDFTLFSNAGLDGDVSNHDVEFADIDNDGDLDVLFSGVSGVDPPTILLNRLVEDGSLSFDAVSRLNPPAAGGCEALEMESPSGPLDFNGDAFVDIYCGKMSQPEDVIYLNRGVSQPGFFDELTGVPFPTTGQTYGADFGDLDLDGRVDMVQGDYSPGWPMIYLNRPDPGDPTLPAFVVIPEPTSPGGRGNPNTYWQSMISDIPPPAFVEPPDANSDVDRNGFLESLSPTMRPVLADFDGDGALDIIFAMGDGSSRSARIYLNDICRIAAPVIECPADATIECSESTDPSNTGMATATDVCDPDPSITFVDAETPGVCAEEETITRTWTATNAAGNSSSCDQTIEVVDTTPPMVMAGADNQVCLWPPNHRYVSIDGVTSEVQITDNCDPDPMPTQIVCDSNQCDNAPCAENPGENGDGNTVDDCVYDPATDRLAARVERAGTDPEGRTYTLSLTAVDSCGNVSDPADVFFVDVPHDQNPRMECISSNPKGGKNK